MKNSKKATDEKSISWILKFLFDFGQIKIKRKYFFQNWIHLYTYWWDKSEEKKQIKTVSLNISKTDTKTYAKIILLLRLSWQLSTLYI